MSRIGKQPITVPKEVEVTLNNGVVVVTGPQGTLNETIPRGIEVTSQDSVLTVTRRTNSPQNRALHGLIRSLIQNMVIGVTEGYKKSLALMGIGYRAQQDEEGIILNVGFSHSVPIKPPPGITLVVEGTNQIHVHGIDKQKVGQIASEIRRVRPPNAYKEKGIRYANEIIRLKKGKTAGTK